MTPALAALLLAATGPSESFDALLRRLVETDTTLAAGSCTAAAATAAAALRAGGFPEKSLKAFSDPKHPQEGGLLAQLPGRNRAKKPLLLVAHIDTVPVDPGEWTHPPFRLTIDNGYLYGRGVADNKAVAALLIELLIDLRRAPKPPSRAVAVALTCGEETPAAFSGAHWIATEGRRLIDPGLVLVPSGGATLDAEGRPASVTVAVAEKVQQNFRLEVRGTASHASVPTADNAIASLAKAIANIAEIRFPVTIAPAVRAQLTRAAEHAAPGDAAAIKTVLIDSTDTAALTIVTAHPAWNAWLRTTCVTTVVDTGRQANTVAAVATANINCRMLPGTAVPSVHDALVQATADPRVTVTAIEPLASSSPTRPYPTALIETLQKSAAAVWPGSVIVPSMLTGATDARHFDAVGIPAYGVTLLPYDADGSRVHAADERLRITSIDDGRKLLRRLVSQLLR